MPDWSVFWKKHYSELKDVWGIKHDKFILKLITLLFFMTCYGVRWTITSGLRSKEKQAELLKRYEAGDKGIVAKPAQKSLHLDGLAVDISCSNPPLMGWLARYLGLRWGGTFKDKDPVHVDYGTA